MVWFYDGAPADMGIFAGYGAGWYCKYQGEEMGPYDTENEAIDAHDAQMVNGFRP